MEAHTHSTSSGCFSSYGYLSFSDILQFPVFIIVKANFVTHFVMYDLLIVDFIYGYGSVQTPMLHVV